MVGRMSGLGPLPEHRAAALAARAPADSRKPEIQAARRAAAELFDLVNRTHDIIPPADVIAGLLLEVVAERLDAEREWIQREARAATRGELDALLRAIDDTRAKFAALRPE
jgi:hypothetical protein